MSSDKEDRKEKNRGAENGKDEEEKSHYDRRMNRTEMVFTVLSSILLFALIIYLAVRAFHPESKPDIVLKATESSGGQAFNTLTVKVENLGDKAAQNVLIRGEVFNGNDSTTASQGRAEAETILDWLPGKSTEEVYLVFPKERDLKNVNLTVTGYSIP